MVVSRWAPQHHQSQRALPTPTRSTGVRTGMRSRTLNSPSGSCRRGRACWRTRIPHLDTPTRDRSADLDALAAFVASLHPKPSPFRRADGTLTPAAERGQVVFHRADVGCALRVMCRRFLRICACMISARATGRGNSWGRGLIRHRYGGCGIRRRIYMMGGLPRFGR